MSEESHCRAQRARRLILWGALTSVSLCWGEPARAQPAEFAAPEEAPEPSEEPEPDTPEPDDASSAEVDAEETSESDEASGDSEEEAGDPDDAGESADASVEASAEEELAAGEAAVVSPLEDPESPVAVAEEPVAESEASVPLADDAAPEEESVTVVADEQSYEPKLAKPPRPPTPFDQGRVRLGLGLGWISTTTTDWMMLGVGAGYFVVDGLELGASTTFWLIGDPFIATVTPEVRYVLHFVPVVKPYVGGFYRHYFVSKELRDTDSVGARAGVYFMAGSSSYFGVGAVYEHFLDDDLFLDRNQVYPEITFALAF